MTQFVMETNLLCTKNIVCNMIEILGLLLGSVTCLLCNHAIYVWLEKLEISREITAVNIGYISYGGVCQLISPINHNQRFGLCLVDGGYTMFAFFSFTRIKLWKFKKHDSIMYFIIGAWIWTFVKLVECHEGVRITQYFINKKCC